MTAPAVAKKSFLPARRAGQFLFVSGQLPLVDGQIPTPGTVGDTVSVEQAIEAARDVTSVVKLNGYVASAPGFTAQAAVIDAASDVIMSSLGEAGEHARLSIGVAALPLGAPVEIELIVTTR
jgi:enamine deaminase RidA (YjgF/YER057c/UK114 family)